MNMVCESILRLLLCGLLLLDLFARCQEVRVLVLHPHDLLVGRCSLLVVLPQALHPLADVPFPALVVPLSARTTASRTALFARFSFRRFDRLLLSPCQRIPAISNLILCVLWILLLGLLVFCLDSSFIYSGQRHAVFIAARANRLLIAQRLRTVQRTKNMARVLQRLEQQRILRVVRVGVEHGRIQRELTCSRRKACAI